MVALNMANQTTFQIEATFDPYYPDSNHARKRLAGDNCDQTRTGR